MAASRILEQEKFKRVVTRNTILSLSLAAVLTGAFVYLVLQLVEVGKALNHSDQVIAQAHEVFQLAVDAETGQRGYVITGKEQFLEPYQHSRKNWRSQIDSLKAMVSDNPVQLAHVKRVEDLYGQWMKYAEDLMELKDEPASARKLVASEKGKDIMDELRTELSRFVAQESAIRDDRSDRSRDSVYLALVLIVSSMVAVAGMIAFLSRRQLSAVASIYGEALERADTQAQALQEQNWLRAGQSQLAEVVRGDHTLEAVCSRSLEFLAGYLDAKVGAIYSVIGTELIPAAVYALPPEDEAGNRRIQVGDSMLGQAVASARAITLDPAPANYLKVSSSLGEASVASVVVQPLVADGIVRAVVELGFLRPLQAREKELLEIVSEGLAIAINSAKSRTRLQELLEESQRQAEELQAQQEELRVNNEELEEQSSLLKESQARLESQQAELEQTNNQLQQQAESLEQQNEELNQTRSVLEIKASELQKASEYKSQFLANMSHELRTPLNSTLILSQLLIDNKAGRLSDEEVEYARTILSSSNDLLNLINDILDLAKVEAGKIEFHPEPVPLEQVAEGLGRTFSPIAKNKGVAFDWKLEPGTPDVFETDRLRLEQILRNLLSNAVKFTDEGSVSLSISARPGGKVAFTVRDTGLGIPKEKHQAIFDAFQQGDGTTSRRFGGTGLGLTISRDLARLLKGEIQLESEPGKGSVFTLVLSPVSSSEVKASESAAPAPSVPATAVQPALPRKTFASASFKDDRESLDSSLKLLMVVEDDQAFAKVMYEMSHEVSFQCIVTHLAEEAVEMAEQYMPNAVILDMHLPDHSGLFVLDRLKENPATRHIPVHVISAKDFSQAALQMGAVGYLRKPAKKSEIEDVIRKLEGKLEQGIRRVLIVEDNSTQLESMKKLISYEAVEVAAVRTGAEAIDLLQSTAFDCLILDLSLPDMSGYEILERMNASESLSHPPVIVYTGRDLTRAEEERLQKYSQSIILKGAKSPERLLSEVGLFLHQVESKMPPERQRALRELRDREQDLEGKDILLVDDDVRNIFALKNALEQRGARIEIARNGREAVSKVQTAAKLDLVLMDIMMPEMNGYEAMREIRRDPKYRELPIIAVTAKAMADDQEKCLEAGANDYLAKPIDLSKLLSLIRVWLHPARKL